MHPQELLEGRCVTRPGMADQQRLLRVSGPPVLCASHWKRQFVHRIRLS
jgi:hypothetical protein